MDIDQIMSRLADATDAELAEALQVIGREAEGLREAETTEDNVAKLERYAEARKAVLAEQNKRAGEMADRDELAKRQSAAAATFTEAEGEQDTPPADGDGDGNGTDTPPADEGGEDPDPETDDGEGVTAAGRRPLGTITKRGRKGDGTPKFSGQVTATTQVQGNIPGFEAGSQVDREKLAQAFMSKANTLQSTRTRGQEKYHVARVNFAFPEERMLTADSYAVNTKRIEQANARQVTQQGLTAALCQPLEPIYDISVLGVTDRPIRDALNRFGVDRGGIQYRAPFDALSGLDAEGMGIWTPADDDADPLVPKTCLEVSCPGVEEAQLYATYLCLTFPNFTARFDQEWVDATTQASLVAWARFAENELFKHILAGSKLLTAATAVSAVRDILVNLDKAVAYYRYRHRLNDMVPLRWIGPRWVLDVMRADLTRGIAGDLEAISVADAQIRAWFAARGVTPTFHLDGLADDTYTETDPDLVIGAGDGIGNGQTYPDATAGDSIPDFIGTIESVLYAEGDWLLLDGGTMDLGLVRDSTLNQNNRYQTFVETFEGVAFDGIESLRLQMNVEPSGSSVGTITSPDPS